MNYEINMRKKIYRDVYKSQQYTLMSMFYVYNRKNLLESTQYYEVGV